MDSLRVKREAPPVADDGMKWENGGAEGGGGLTTSAARTSTWGCAEATRAI